jgi:F0F1-type ATP synthase, alpha subunit
MLQLVLCEVGTVVSVFIGIVCVHGLFYVGFDELLLFFGGLLGIVFNFDVDGIDVVLLGDYVGV